MTIRCCRIALVAITLLIGVVYPAASSAQGDAGVTIDATMGYEAAYRTGDWFPVVVELGNAGADLSGQLVWRGPDGSSRVATLVELPRGARQQIVVDVFVPESEYVRVGRIELVVDDAVVAAAEVTLTQHEPTTPVMLVASSDQSLLRGIVWQPEVMSGVEVHHVVLEQLSPRVAALQGFDVLVVHGIDTSTLGQAQREALSDWVMLGGQLVISGGGDPRALAGFADLAPVTITGVERGSLARLAAVAPGSAALPDDVALSQVTPAPQARAWPAAGDLVYSRAVGRGAIHVTRFDLARLRGWDGNAAFWAQLVPLRDRGSLGALERGDFAPPLLNGLVLAELQLPGVGSIALFFLLYLIAIGPLHYLVLRRFDRLDWGWITVPLTILAFVGVAYLVGIGARGTVARIYGITVVEAMQSGSRGLATTSLSIFSPTRTSYRMALPAGALVAERRGGLDATGAARITGGPADTTVSEVLVDLGGLRSVVVESTVPFTLRIDSRLARAADDQLTGTLQLLAGPALDGALLTTGGGAYGALLGPLDAGTPVVVRRRVAPADAIADDAVPNLQVRTIIRELIARQARDDTDPAAIYLWGWRSQPTLDVALSEVAVQQHLTIYAIRLDDR
ncbi:MAG: hypothetical protein KGS47_08790 [Chloroflexi bacterium]|nr:hypothetical protein [Chloroflexota bacterium]